MKRGLKVWIYRTYRQNTCRNLNEKRIERVLALRLQKTVKRIGKLNEKRIERPNTSHLLQKPQKISMKRGLKVAFSTVDKELSHPR